MTKPLQTVTLEFLGTGTSTGIPVLGCRCAVCRSPDPRDRRFRSSVLLRHGSRNVVIDTGPEFRLQCLRSGVMNLDSVLFTHDHADHLHGIDDLRAFSLFKRKTLPVWANRDTTATIRKRFAYMWRPLQKGGGVPDLELRVVDGRFKAGGMVFTPVPIRHGRIEILGYRVGDAAYMTDISALPETSLPLLEGVRTMIVSCVRQRRHPTHFSIAGAVALHKLVKPERTLLTHLTHYLSHKEMSASLPVGMMPAYDGLTLDVCL